MGFIVEALHYKLFCKVHSSSDEDPYSLTQSGSSGYSAGAYPGTRDPSLYPTVRVQVTRSIDRKKDGQIDINLDRQVERLNISMEKHTSKLKQEQFNN